jgi:hypothetical protein
MSCFVPSPPDEFSAFNEPGYLKIAWTLRVDPIDAGRSLFRTETRATATGPEARAKFRRYRPFFSPGMMLIRWTLLVPLKKEARRRVGGGGAGCDSFAPA